MPHIIIYDGTDGPEYHRADSLDEAVRHVEQLRNNQDIDGAEIFALEPVRFELKPYYRVELGDDDVDTPARAIDLRDRAGGDFDTDTLGNSDFDDEVSDVELEAAGAGFGAYPTRRGLFGR